MNARPVLKVLAYHRIAECNGDALRDRPELTVTPREFEFQMRAIAENYAAVSLDDVMQAGEAGHALPGRSVLITFDDAYSSVGDIAWPILRKLELPATVFVPTAYPSQEAGGFWWDRLRAAISETEKRQLMLDGYDEIRLSDREERLKAYKFLRAEIKNSVPQRAQEILEAVCEQLGEPAAQKEVMSWERIRELASEGMSFAPHSHSHPILTRVDQTRLEEELVRPIEILQQRLGTAPAAIAYPSGQYDRQVVEVARSVGYKIGFTTEMRHDRLNADTCMTLGRVCLSARFSRLAFRVSLQPGGTRIAETYRYLKAGLKRVLH